MIVKVFDHIYISNVYNANDIYHLINLNIGGVLTCFRCMSIEWCHHDPKENRKIFYKDKFLNCKGELLRDPGGWDYSSLPLCQNASIPISGPHQSATKLTPCSTSARGDSVNGGNTPSHGATDSKEEDLFAQPYAHYDYILYPLEILKKKITKETIDDYITAMVHLKDDVEVNCVPVAENDISASAEEEIKKCLDGALDDEGVKGNEGQENRTRQRSCSLADEKTLFDKKSSSPSGSAKPTEGKNQPEGVSRSAEDLKVPGGNDGKTPPHPLKGQKSQGSIKTVCELNGMLRDEKNRMVPFSNVYKMKHMYLDILDTFDENILNHVDRAHAFIDDVIKNNKNVLVHCVAGISRCSSIILSYISKKNGKSIAENFSTLKDRYPFAHPNEGFYRQLLLYEKMNYTLDGRSQYHRVYEEIKSDRGGLERLKCMNLKNEPEPTYKFRCKLCRLTLFNDNDIIQHELDKYKIKKKYGQSCTSIFIEKKEWVLTENKMKGALICPNKNRQARKMVVDRNMLLINTSNVDRMKINPNLP
ncbi:hypothetical protein AK88_00667 [Plasmodium fragile]|uniref:protein-tyrosine-phosphatase n=1 Tax=Plasmodium fragile TaxID=5857 RepID=A0A0D9QSE2_PLAFR|nr:uncharacterized protein AK88_00667 [Plasmodium fragile]KJP89707.1 hypothetical protein AK88_00667 [Plasmodium fragile]